MGEALDKAAAERIGDIDKDGRDHVGRLAQRPCGRCRMREDDVGLQSDQLRGLPFEADEIARRGTILDVQIASFDPSQLAKAITEAGEPTPVTMTSRFTPTSSVAK